MGKKYHLDEEGYIYGVVDGPFRVKIDRIEGRRHFLKYLGKPDMEGHGSMLSDIEMKKHFITKEEFNPLVHK